MHQPTPGTWPERLPTFLQERGAWLWAVAILGALLRIHLVCFSEGTLDVLVWQGHADEILSKGIVEYYHGGRFQFNHPPLMGWLFSSLRELGLATGIPFRFLLRAPFAILDAGTAVLLVRVLAASPYRYLAGALYWLHPLALIFSAHHGNTDPAIAFFVLAAVLLVSRERPAAAGAVLGLALWVKVPGVLALPALAMGLPSWRARARFVAAWAGVGIVSYLPVLFADARVVIDSVFLYSGLRIQTQSGVQVWGIQNFYPDPASLPFDWRRPFRNAVALVYRYNTLIALVPIVVVAWCRRREAGARDVARNVGRAYVILYGFTNFWAFQYFAWSIPLWLAWGWRFGLAASVVATAYIYALYVWLCDSWWLIGEWDFIAKADWPSWLVLLRDGCNLFFFAAAWGVIVSALRTEWRYGRQEREGARAEAEA